MIWSINKHKHYSGDIIFAFRYIEKNYGLMHKSKHSLIWQMAYTEGTTTIDCDTSLKTTDTRRIT